MAQGKKTGGRAPGKPNKLTSKAKDALMEVFQGIGDVPQMIKWAKKNPDKFYTLWCRLVPTEVHGKGFTPPPPPKDKAISDAEFARRVAFVLAAGLHEMEHADLFKKEPGDVTAH